MADWKRLMSEAKGVLYHLYGFVLGRKEWMDYRRKFLKDAWAGIVRNSPAYESDMESAAERHNAELDSLASSAEGAHAHMNDLLAAKEKARAAADLKASGLETRLVRAKEEVEMLETHPMMRLGEHITEESTCGVIEFNRNNKVVAANRHACRYLGVELEHILDKNIVEAAGHEEMTSKYLAVFAANAMALLREGKSFEPNTFEIGGIPFDIMGYASNSGTRKFPVYGGGFIVLSPFKRQSTVRAALGKLWSSSTIHVRDIVSIENVVGDYAKPLMGMSGAKPCYIDFKKLRSITPVAVNILAKCYGALKSREVTCIFRNAPYDVAQMLLDRGVAPEHVRNAKMLEKAYLVPEKSLG